jgi:EAL domain-containing protein (putative c-di-GMP-specific phosphodiesterase class I)
MMHEGIPNFSALEKGRVGLHRVVELAHRHLGLDLVYIAELTSGSLLFREVAGDTASFGVRLHDGIPAQGTYSQLLAAGRIPPVIPDTSADARVAALAATSHVGIGAYIGVPLALPDGTPYGTLCGVNHEPDPSLGERDVAFMTILAELIVFDLEEQRRRANLHRALTELIETEDIEIAFQPIVDIHSGACLGVEALSRFPEPFDLPEQLFADADAVGLSLELERLAIREAWNGLALIHAEQFLAFNVSPDALLELGRRAQGRADLPLSQVVVEVTEQSVVRSYDELRDVVVPLRGQGLRVAVDDAGAGYASLQHIVELRPDFIKVDRSLVHGVADDHARRVAISAFVLLALDLGATVVAEGVERPHDLSALCDLGVTAAQGYLLGRASTRKDDLSKLALTFLGAPAPQTPARPERAVAAMTTPAVGAT